MHPYRQPAERLTFENYSRKPRWRGWCWLGSHVPVLIVIDGSVVPLPEGVTLKAKMFHTRHVLEPVDVRCLYCKRSWGEIFAEGYLTLDRLANLYGNRLSKYRPLILGVQWG